MSTKSFNPEPSAMRGRAPGNSREASAGPCAPSRRMAVPVFMGRVAPVLDTCTRLLVMDVDAAPPAERQVHVSARTIPERVQELIQLGICVIICGALSDLFYSFLKENGIQLICGIAGDIDEVLAAYREGTLARACFRMPGAGAASLPGEQNEP